MLRTLLILIAVLLPLSAEILVEPAWLAQHLRDRDLVVIHVGDEDGFQQRHIPGARQLSIADISKPGSAMMRPAPQAMSSNELLFEVAAVPALREKLESIGISNRSRIVLYLGPEQPLPGVTRVAHVLDYLGLGDRYSVLNGGLAAWDKAGYKTTAETTAVARGQLSVRPKESAFVDADFVKSAAAKGYKIVDARGAVNYRGLEPTFGKKAGHIPGAINIPFTDLNDDAQQFQRSQIEARFREAGIKSGDKLVVYCHIGMQATEVIFAARLLGIDAALYDGSFQDWALNARGEVEK